MPRRISVYTIIVAWRIETPAINRTIFLSAQQLVRAPRGVSGTAARSETDTTAKAAVTNDLGLIATTFLTGHRRYDTGPRAPPGERQEVFSLHREAGWGT